MDFIVTALPRSGTAWCANWLTTEDCTCFHEPFMLESIHTEKPHFGIACTVSWLFQSEIPRLVIHRDLGEINASLSSLNLPNMTAEHESALWEASGRHVEFEQLWDEAKAKEIHEYLINWKPFDPERYRILKGLRIQALEWSKQ